MIRTLVFLISLFFTQNLFAIKSNILKKLTKSIIHKEAYINFYFDGSFHNGHLILRRVSLTKEQVLNNPYKHGILQFDQYKDILINLENVSLEEMDQGQIRGGDFFVLYFKEPKYSEVLYIFEIAESGIEINGIRYKFNKKVMDIIWQMFPEIYKEQHIIRDTHKNFYNKKLF
ncbi:MAG: hypothetical protein LBV16_09500 [Elusimicrobiota bacterium]|jgi:hypothetical protein|nr:hypothetical protein [Elusimicrobiota bacterium]